MGQEFDVIVVGARCAGSPLATLLARQGVRVAVVERATFPRDTLSTHIVEAPAINFLSRLGVLDELRAAGVRIGTRVDGRQNDFCYQGRVGRRPGDRGAFMSARRHVLDPILAGAAQRAGAEIMMGTNVVGLVEDGSRLCGVRVQQAGRERALRGRLVVGADGRNSTVARLVNARKYNVVPSERFAYWSFFEGVDPGPDPAIVYHRWEGRLVIATPADGSLYEVIVIPDERFRAEFAADRERAFMDQAMACAPVAEALRGARRVGKLFGIKRWEGFFRESAGPGWALVGDAGHFKDPAPGQGMTDAFRQTEALAPAIIAGIAGSDPDLDLAIADWARWRDRDAGEHHWLAADFGAAGPSPAVVPEMMRRLDHDDRMSDVLDLLQHRALPSAVFTPGRLVAATASLMTQPGTDRGAVLREVGGLLREDVRRRRLMRQPRFVAAQAHRDAGETEVTESLVTA